MKAIPRIVTLVVAAAIASAGTTLRAQNQDTPQAKARTAMIGKMAPELAVNQWVHTNGKVLSLKALRGKLVVLDFFTFW